MRHRGVDDGIATTWDKDHPHPGYPAGQDGFVGKEGLGAYNRKIPDNFQGPGSGDDQFMNSMIDKYALELATPDGKPTGNFVFKKVNAYMAAQEVVATHLGLHDKANTDYLD